MNIDLDLYTHTYTLHVYINLYAVMCTGVRAIKKNKSNMQNYLRIVLSKQFMFIFYSINCQFSSHSTIDILMATATSIYWCLVLVDFVLLSSAATLVQTSPSYSPVCPGDRLVLTCTTTTGIGSFWKVPGGPSTAEDIPSSGRVIAGLILNITNIDGSTITSTGIYQSINESLNGSVIGCTGATINPVFDSITINIITG